MKTRPEITLNEEAMQRFRAMFPGKEVSEKEKNNENRTSTYKPKLASINEQTIKKFMIIFPSKEAPELGKNDIEKPSIRETKSTPTSPRDIIETSIFAKSSLDAISKNGDDSNFSFEIKHKIKDIAAGKQKNESNNHLSYNDANETGITISVEEVKSLGHKYNDDSDNC